MREQLIKILESHYISHKRFQIESDLANIILAKLRCDKCKYWAIYGPDKITGEGTCEELTEDVIFTKPDFFCAKWEPKA